jgi:hypothetical protein
LLPLCIFFLSLFPWFSFLTSCCNQSNCVRVSERRYVHLEQNSSTVYKISKARLKEAPSRFLSSPEHFFMKLEFTNPSYWRSLYKLRTDHIENTCDSGSKFLYLLPTNELFTKNVSSRNFLTSRCLAVGIRFTISKLKLWVRFCY